MAIYVEEVSRTFGEYLLIPGLTTKQCVPSNVSLRTPLVKHNVGAQSAIELNIPFVSAIMQSVSGPELAIELARNGGLSFIFGSQPIASQAEMVRKVKKFKAGFVTSDSNLTPEHTLDDVLRLLAQTGHSTIGITDDGTPNGKLLGLVTSRDYRISRDARDKKIKDFMTPFEKLIVGEVGLTLSEANQIIWDHKLNTLPIIDKEQHLAYFVFRKDYDSHKENPNEEHLKDPFNHYGKSKWQAEQILHEWYKLHPDWNIDIIRPTVIFGERNRGNVYNLLKQIASGKFLMIGSGNNKKSMAYVGNVVAFVKYMIDEVRTGYNVFNYVDKPDFTMNELVAHVSKVMNKHIPATHFPYWLGMIGGYCFDIFACITRKKLAVSSVRVKKFCATTEFDAAKIHSSVFKAPYSLGEGLARTLEFEFIYPPTDDITFKSE